MGSSESIRPMVYMWIYAVSNVLETRGDAHHCWPRYVHRAMTKFRDTAKKCYKTQWKSIWVECNQIIYNLSANSKFRHITALHDAQSDAEPAKFTFTHFSFHYSHWTILYGKRRKLRLMKWIHTFADLSFRFSSQIHQMDHKNYSFKLFLF